MRLNWIGWMLGLVGCVLAAGCDGILFEPVYGPGSGGRYPTGPDGDVLAGGDEPAEIWWLWNKPLGEARQMPFVNQFVRISVHRASGRGAADKIVDQILQRGLQHQQIAILLQDYGMSHGDPTGIYGKGLTPLFQHYEDGVDPTTTEYYYLTPWMSNGIATCRAWMDEFIERYKQRQAADPRIPDPFRFHFDSENEIRAHSGDGFGALRAFDAMRSDSRWNREIIPGWGKTMDQLYREAGSPSYDVNQRAGATANKDWRVWYQAILAQAMSAGMNESSYKPIRAAWPGTLCSNFNTSKPYEDSKGTAPRYGSHRHFGDTIAPVLYFGVDNARIWVPKWLSAWGGTDPKRLTPWIEMIGSREQTPERFEELVALLREFGVREFLVWGEGTSITRSHWEAFSEIVERGPAGKGGNVEE